MLRFGPYRQPRYKIGDKLDCDYAGTLRIVAISDAPVQWPLGVVRGHRIPILCGELVRAVRSESAGDVAAAWGVGSGLVTKWRKALRVKGTKGEHLRRSENIKATDPARAGKIGKAKLGNPSVKRSTRRQRPKRTPTPQVPFATVCCAKTQEESAYVKRSARGGWDQVQPRGLEFAIPWATNPAEKAELT
jgi:hypothetical protein